MPLPVPKLAFRRNPRYLIPAALPLKQLLIFHSPGRPSPMAAGTPDLMSSAELPALSIPIDLIYTHAKLSTKLSRRSRFSSHHRPYIRVVNTDNSSLALDSLISVSISGVILLRKHTIIDGSKKLLVLVTLHARRLFIGDTKLLFDDEGSQCKSKRFCRRGQILRNCAAGLLIFVFEVIGHQAVIGYFPVVHSNTVLNSRLCKIRRAGYTIFACALSNVKRENIAALHEINTSCYKHGYP
jgi:hypothetical protein